MASRAFILLPLQSMTSMAAVVLWPPAEGKMMIVPLADADRNAAAMVAAAAGAAVIAAGPLPGSVIVSGDRAAIAARAGWTMPIVAAPAAGCGAAIGTDPSS